MFVLLCVLFMIDWSIGFGSGWCWLVCFICCLILSSIWLMIGLLIDDISFVR